jgi:hypothetical protein
VVQLLGFILSIGYFILLILNCFFDYGSNKDIVFSLVLAIISISLIYKGVLLKSSSTLWFSLSLILYAILILTMGILNIDYSNYHYIFALIPIIPSIINIIIFQNLVYIKVIIINITIFIPIIIKYYFTISQWLYIISFVVSIILGIIFCRCIKFDKEKV